MVKTITVTEEAYKTLKSMKAPTESFSEEILRIARRRPLNDFYGALSGERGARLEKAIAESRKGRMASHKSRIKRIMEELRWR